MIKLELCKEIYNKQSISIAMGAFRDLAKISINEFGNYYEISFNDCSYDESMTMREFENYVIDLQNVRTANVD